MRRMERHEQDGKAGAGWKSRSRMEGQEQNERRGAGWKGGSRKVML